MELNNILQRLQKKSQLTKLYSPKKLQIKEKNNFKEEKNEIKRIE